MKIISSMAAAAIALSGTMAAAAGEADVKAWIADHPDGTRATVAEVVVEANQTQAWQAITTAEGWKSWAVPFAHFDSLRLGAVIETSYAPNARVGDANNIRNRVLAYLPERMLSIQAFDAPPGFKHPELLKDTFTVIELEVVDPTHTRVRLTGCGYRSGQAFQEMQQFFLEGNAWTLGQLAKRFREGPVDWTKARPPVATN
jgi:uncharacterized protein YndB with AHSA1/START domain